MVVPDTQVSVEEARSRIEEIKEPYKMEILEGILARDPASTITIWHIGEQGQKDHWWDLCAGPHVPTTGHIAPDAIDLETVAGTSLPQRPLLFFNLLKTPWDPKPFFPTLQANSVPRFVNRRPHLLLGSHS